MDQTGIWFFGPPCHIGLRAYLQRSKSIDNSKIFA